MSVSFKRPFLFLDIASGYVVAVVVTQACLGIKQCVPEYKSLAKVSHCVQLLIFEQLFFLLSINLLHNVIL